MRNIRTPTALSLALALGVFGAGVSAQSDGMSEGIVSSVVKAPIIADGDAAGAPTDIVISFNTDLDPSVEGRTLLAGNTVRITLPEAFESAGLPADVPTACATFEGECNTGGFLQGWPQRPLPLTAEFFTVEMDGTHSLVFTAVQDLGPSATPGIKQMHLFLLGFTNPEAGDYAIEVEAQTGPDGEVETGTAVLTIHPEIRPSINVTSIFAKDDPDAPNGNTIYQSAAPGEATPFAWDFLLWGADGNGIVGAELVQGDDAGGDIVMGEQVIGSFSIDAPDGATGQTVTGGPSVEAAAPVSGYETGRMTAQFTAGDTAGTYVTTFEMDGGNSLQMHVEVAE